jgi:uncharacterized protein (TIGR02271 family)
MAETDYASWQGRTVYGTDGEKIGKIADLYDDDSGGRPVFATVHTGLFGARTSFVPLDRADLRGDDVFIPYGKDQVKGAPHVEADAEVSDEEVDEIYRYYETGAGAGGATAGAGTSETEGAAGSAGTGAGGIGAAGGGAIGAADADTTGISGATGTTGTQGHDTSGPTTDQAMTRSEEQVTVGTRQVEAGRARLRKYVVTENVTQTVPVSHEEVRVEREPITEGNMPAATDGPAISAEEHEVVLHAEQPVVQKEAVPVERVRLGTERVQEEQTVSETARKEAIELDDSDTAERAGRR